MRLDVVSLPALLTEQHVVGRSVVVFDVLRATTSMTAALAAGVSAICIYATPAEAAAAAGPPREGRLLCGEVGGLAPAGFDLGNSPRAFGRAHRGRTAHVSTTNGTRAIVAARGAAAVYAAAIVNAAAVARAVAAAGRDVTLLCAGTDGAVAIEDVLGAGAVFDALEKDVGGPAESRSDEPLIARDLFRAAKADLRAALAAGRGGQNVIAIGLDGDIDYAARLNAVDVVGCITEPAARPPVVRAISP